MTSIDVGLVCFLALAGWRGAARGFFRESFSLLGVLGGIAAAFVCSASAAELLRSNPSSPGQTELLRGLAFVGIFVGVAAALSLAGYVLERLFGALVAGVPSRTAGALVGVSKGAVFLGFLLLFLYLFVPSVNARIGASTISRTLIAAAGNALRTGAAMSVASGHRE